MILYHLKKSNLLLTRTLKQLISALLNVRTWNTFEGLFNLELGIWEMENEETIAFEILYLIYMLIKISK